MVRVKSSVPTRKRKKRVLKQTKGQFGHRKSRYRQAKKSLIKGMVYAFRDRKVRKRDFRSLWILRINAACRQEGLTYSQFLKGLKVAGVVVNRKMLAEMVVNAPETFKKLIGVAKEAVPAKA